MNQPLQQFLTAFDALSDTDKHIAAVEVLRRAWPNDVPTLPDEALIEAADAIFIDLDAREAEGAES
jgi:hypothetical protein